MQKPLVKHILFNIKNERAQQELQNKYPVHLCGQCFLV
jgi:hypothetical protein